MERTALVSMVREKLKGRQLVYFGTRADDAEGVFDIPELTAVFSLVAASRVRSDISSMSLELLTGVRVDLDAYDIDDEPQSEHVVELRRAMLRALARESVVFTYRPSTFLSAICFARQERCEYAGLFKDHQAAFEHKPWVESSVRHLGISAIPWTYIADDDQFEVLEHLDEEAIVLRTSRSSGGAGVAKVADAEALRAAWHGQDEFFMSVAPYIEGGVPANVGGVVWTNGVTLHGVSVQLIGIPGCTTRPFGYCGNDFAAARDFDPDVVNQMEENTKSIGRWMQSHGYLGAFGVDYLVAERDALFTEVNPRLQGVTHLSCQLAAQSGRSCIMLEHLAANLGISVPESVPLSRQLEDGTDAAHVVLHHLPSTPAAIDSGSLQDLVLSWDGVTRIDVVCPESLQVQQGGTTIRITADQQLTKTGFELCEPWASRVSEAAIISQGLR
jgi:hypothetical protein